MSLAYSILALFAVSLCSFVQVAFSRMDCRNVTVGAVELYNSKASPDMEGIVIVCIAVESEGSYEYRTAAFCWGGNSTFNEGAAAAACRQAGRSSYIDYNSAEV